jgi:hypothetical protein
VEKEAKLPSLMGDRTDEELDSYTIQHAKYFTVVQVNRGGFVGGGQNYNREQVDSLEQAQQRAKELYERDGKAILIYAIADFSGAVNFSRHVDNYPKSSWKSKGQKAHEDKKAKAEARERARQARLNLGSKRVAGKSEMPS